MKENLKPYAYKQSEGFVPDGVLFVERSGELQSVARLNDKVMKPKGNRVLIGRIVTGCRPETG